MRRICYAKGNDITPALRGEVHKKNNSIYALRKRLEEFQRKMRKTPTNAEQRFKTILSEVLNTLPNTFRKDVIFQKIFIVPSAVNCAGFIGDFYIPDKKILFEIDGMHHQRPNERAHDQRRSLMLYRKLGIKTFRISNIDTKDAAYTKKFIKNSLNGKKTVKTIIKNTLSRKEEIKQIEQFIEIKRPFVPVNCHTLPDSVNVEMIGTKKVYVFK
jgi:very-short-patch-repair endonuclease